MKLLASQKYKSNISNMVNDKGRAANVYRLAPKYKDQIRAVIKFLANKNVEPLSILHLLMGRKSLEEVADSKTQESISMRAPNLFASDGSFNVKTSIKTEIASIFDNCFRSERYGLIKENSDKSMDKLVWTYEALQEKEPVKTQFLLAIEDDPLRNTSSSHPKENVQVNAVPEQEIINKDTRVNPNFIKAKSINDNISKHIEKKTTPSYPISNLSNQITELEAKVKKIEAAAKNNKDESWQDTASAIRASFDSQISQYKTAKKEFENSLVSFNKNNYQTLSKKAVGQLTLILHSDQGADKEAEEVFKGIIHGRELKIKTRNDLEKACSFFKARGLNNIAEFLEKEFNSNFGVLLRQLEEKHAELQTLEKHIQEIIPPALDKAYKMVTFK